LYVSLNDLVTVIGHRRQALTTSVIHCLKGLITLFKYEQLRMIAFIVLFLTYSRFVICLLHLIITSMMFELVIYSLCSSYPSIQTW